MSKKLHLDDCKKELALCRQIGEPKDRANQIFKAWTKGVDHSDEKTDFQKRSGKLTKPRRFDFEVESRYVYRRNARFFVKTRT